MKFLTKQEFQSLSELEKSSYYDALMEERQTSVTANQLEVLAAEFAKIDYMDSADVTKELLKEAALQYEADAEYVREKRKKGIMITLIILCVAVLAVSAGIVIGMF